MPKSLHLPSSPLASTHRTATQGTVTQRLFGRAPGALLIAALMGISAGCASNLRTLRDSTPQATGIAGTENAFQAKAYHHFLMALDQERVGDLEGALDHLRQALVFDPESHQIMTRTSIILEQMGHPEDSLSMAQQALDRDGDYVPALAQLAHLYAFGGQFESAKEVLEKAISLKPSQESLYLELARLHRREGNIDQALEVLADYETRTPRTSVYHMSLKAIILRSAERPEEAEAAYLDLMSTYPWLEQARRELVDLLIETGGPEYAAERLEGLFEAEPWQDWIPAALIDLYAALGNIEALEVKIHSLELRSKDYRSLRFSAIQGLIREKNYSDAETLLTPALAFTGDDGDAAHFLHAQLALSQGNYEEAAARFKTIPPASEHFESSLIRRAYALGELGRMDDAILEIEAFLDAHPDSPEALYALGLIYQDVERYEDSLRTLDALLEIDPENIDAYAQRAGALQALGRSDEALLALDKAIDATPGDTRLYRLKAAILGEMREHEEAITVLEAALKQDADSFELRYQLAVSLDQVGRKHEAIAQMKLLLQAYPEDPDILNFIGYTYAELGERLPEAEMMIRQALESDPENGYILDSLGWIFYKQAEYTKAEDILEQAVRFSDREPTITEHLGDVYLKVGKEGQALSVYEFVLKALAEDASADPEAITRVQGKIDKLIEEGTKADRVDVLGG